MELMCEFLMLNFCGHMKSKKLYGKYRKFFFCIPTIEQFNLKLRQVASL